MNKAELMRLGAFVKPEPVKKTVTWKDDAGEDQTFEIVVLPRTAGAMFRGREMAQAGAGREAHSIYLATFVRLGHEDQEEFTYDDCFNMKASFFEALMTAVLEVHGKPKEAPKNSRPPKKRSVS